LQSQAINPVEPPTRFDGTLPREAAIGVDADEPRAMGVVWVRDLSYEMQMARCAVLMSTDHDRWLSRLTDDDFNELTVSPSSRYAVKRMRKRPLMR
jgi:hypothetical protein